MFSYKDESFYTDYFQHSTDFKLIEAFKLSDKKDEKNLYVGSIEALHTVHPLVIRVEIPATFPHHKLKFLTKSLSGYPHLIDSGDPERGNWFCLNTPFAETAEEQLNQEVERLKEWIHRQMREDLPAVIEDPNVRKAIAVANAYSWENPDEVNEFRSDAMLTFVGDFEHDKAHFTELLGYLNCIRTPDNRFYAVMDASIANSKMPYVLVDGLPNSFQSITNITTLIEEYGWDEKTYKHVLPDFDPFGTWVKGAQSYGLKQYTEEEALQKLKTDENELLKENSYLTASKLGTTCAGLTRVHPAHKPILLKEIEERRKEVLEKHGFYPLSPWHEFDNLDEEAQLERCAEEEYNREVYYSEYHQFALGILTGDKVKWFVIYTNRNSANYEMINYQLELGSILVKKLISIQLGILHAQSVDDKQFFGRGAFSSHLRSKEIAIVGLGAIGSMVAEALARSGVSRMGLWDSDVVEPGNICRSAYRLTDMGKSKVEAMIAKIKSINPFVDTNELKGHGCWFEFQVNNMKYTNGSFYGNVNYNSQEDAVKEISQYDLIIDCTGSNEMLHFLSYALPDTEILSLCITNRATHLLCMSSRDGNPFELRKAYLSRIEQDTKNFYVEGTGCYSPTFLATNCDIASLVNLAMRDLDAAAEQHSMMHSAIFSHISSGILADRLQTYRLPGYDIMMNIPDEVQLDAEDMYVPKAEADALTGIIGYLLGAYSADGRHIMVTNIVKAESAGIDLENAYRTSKGIIDYIGDYALSGEEGGTYREESLKLIRAKAEDESINTNNPLLMVRNPDGTTSFFLYINNGLVPFRKQDE